MTSCSLFASGLVSEVNGATPTFSYRRSDHHDDYFGVQLTYLRGASTCFQPGAIAQITPVIRNDAARFSEDCVFKTQGTTYTGLFCSDAAVTDIPNGPLTVTYNNLPRGQPTPIPFVALFGPSPAPQTATVFANALASSTSTYTATASPGFASTMTVYSADATQTQTITVYVKQTQTTTNTNYVSSCSTSPSSSSPITSSSTTTATKTSTATDGPVATSPVVCQASNGQVINTSAGAFIVECGIDRAGGDMPKSPVYPGSSGYEGCIAACAERDGCLTVSYIPNGPCYLKSAIGAANQNSNVIGGRLLASRSSSSATGASASSSPAVNTSPSRTITVTTTVSGTGYQCTCRPTSGLDASLDCPSSNGTTYTSDCGATYAIECYVDRYGDDIPGGASSAYTLNECIADCDATKGCVDVSYVFGSPGTCYKKSAIADIRQNDNIFGARLLTACKSPTQLKLHRKRVVREPADSNKRVHKRGVYGPDYTYTQDSTTVTKTATSTTVYYTTVTVTPAPSGTTTKTVYTTTTKSATVTNSGTTVTQTQQRTVTTCPAVTKRAVL